MAYIDKRLLKAAASAGNKLPLGVGDSLKATYLNYETKMDDKYNKLKYVFRFKLADGTVKAISTTAGKVLAKMAKIAPGSVLMITKLGEQTNTDFDFDIISEPKSAPAIEEPEIENEEDDEENEEDDEESGSIKAKF